MAECHGGGFCLGNYLIRMICWWHFCFVFMLYKKQRCNLRREDTLSLIPNEGKKPANEAQANRKTIGTKYRPTAQAHWTTTLLHWLPSPTSVHSPSALIQELRKRRNNQPWGDLSGIAIASLIRILAQEAPLERLPHARWRESAHLFTRQRTDWTL